MAATSKVQAYETNGNNLEIYVSWKSLSFKVPDPKDKKKTKLILDELNGHVKPSEVCAVIGPSGSGKSSFLNCIAGRNVEGVSGQVLFNEVPRPINFARFTGYVIQDDMYFESLTVYETFKFAANLKLPTVLSARSKLDRVQELLDELDLNKCKDTIIGTVGQGISGGERRRLAIGLEIINHPSLLLLDEPTSGLDSASALMVGNILRRLAQTRQITILCTVHQPRYKLAAMFDKLYFLGKGRELYFGPSVPECLQFFADAGYECPPFENPADFLLDLVNTADTEAKTGDEENNNNQAADSRDAIVTKLAAAYKESELSRLALAYEVSTTAHGDQLFASISSEFYITPWYNQVLVITKRSFLHKWREPIATMTQAFNSIVMPLLFGSVYWQLDLSQQSAYDRISAIALLVLTLSFMPFDILMLFPLERNICNREQASGMYRPISFFVGRTLAETPQHIVFSVITASIAYWMYGLQNSSEHFLRFVLICVAMVFSGSGMLLLFSTMAKNLEQSNLLATFFLLLFMLFDGNWISIDKVPALWKWVRFISPLGYASNAAIVSEYEGLVFECNEQEINDGLCQNVNGITGEEIIYLRGLQDVDVMFNVMMLFVLAAAYRVVGFLFFWLCFRNQTPKQIIQNTCGCN